MRAMPDLHLVKAMVFDVFGTVVDWRTSLIDDFTHWSETHGISADWPALVDAWRQAYVPAME
jgi:2-haloacid dehalogenase